MHTERELQLRTHAMGFNREAQLGRQHLDGI